MSKNPDKKKLKIGEEIIINFFSEKKAVVLEITSRDTYKVQADNGTVLSNMRWPDEKKTKKKSKNIQYWWIVRSTEK